jgi:hypothetical protein
VVEHLLCKWEVLSSNPIPTRKRKKEGRKDEREGGRRKESN